MFLFIIAWTGHSWGGSGDSPFVADELLVQLRPGVSHAKADKVIKGIGATTAGEIQNIQVKKIKVPAHAREHVKEALSHNPNIEFVENNYIASLSVNPNDVKYPSQWHLRKIDAPFGWDIHTGSSGIPIAIIDSGVDPTHPDLADKLLPGYNFLGDNTDTHDVHGHGTAVAGSAAAITNNSIGVAGVAWENPIMPLVVVNTQGRASYFDIAQAITYAADNGAKVMNISIAGPSPSSTLQNAVHYAWDRGAVVVAAAANSGTDTPYYPAACSNTVAVSATTSTDALASWSNFGDWVDVSAPGVSIGTTKRGGTYGYYSGTSFASPITAGLVALIMSVNPSLANDQAVEILEQNADDLGAAGFDPNYGHGRINVNESLLAASVSVPAPDTTPPSASITAPVDGVAVSSDVFVNVSATDDVGVSVVELFINGTFYAEDTTEPYSGPCP
jgi:subtilisin family serine protease